jgi:hypothetical protein
MATRRTRPAKSMKSTKSTMAEPPHGPCPNASVLQFGDFRHACRPSFPVRMFATTVESASTARSSTATPPCPGMPPSHRSSRPLTRGAGAKVCGPGGSGTAWGFTRRFFAAFDYNESKRVVENRKNPKESEMARGGFRPGAGRPKRKGAATTWTPKSARPSEQFTSALAFAMAVINDPDAPLEAKARLSDSGHAVPACEDPGRACAG